MCHFEFEVDNVPFEGLSFHRFNMSSRCNFSIQDKISLYNNALHTQHCAGGKIKKNEMGRVCGAYGGGERCAQGFGGEA
jgi:hypothetical protein